MQHLYFLGIAGQTMSGLAIASKQAGFKVSGVDGNAYPPATDALEAAGIHYHTAYNANHIEDDMVIVLGNAIPRHNVELQEAIKRKLPLLSFPQLVEQLTARQHRIVVAGTHGKTTTTTLIAWMLEQAGQHPDVITGMVSEYFGGSVRLRGSRKVVIEGDEYSSSDLDKASKFLYYHPNVLVLTALDFDHPDLFPSFADMVKAYRHLLDDLPEDVVLIVCGDDQKLMKLVQESGRHYISYGVNEGCDWRAQQIEYGPQETRFEVVVNGRNRQQWTMLLAGEHNVKNALAALIVAEHEKVATADMANGLLSFKGAARRFEVVASVNDITVIDDYAHHPTEVAATLRAAKARYPKGRLWALFKPHTYSRTKALLKAFADALTHADAVLLSEVDAAREAGKEQTVSAAQLADKIGDVKEIPYYVVENDEARRLLLDNLQPGDTVVCMYVSGLKDVVKGLVADLRVKWE